MQHHRRGRFALCAVLLVKFMLFLACFLAVVAAVVESVSGDNGDANKCGFGYEILLTKMEAMDYEMATTAAVTKQQIQSLISNVKALTEATIALSGSSGVLAKTLVDAPRTCKDSSITASGTYLLQPQKGFSEPFLVRCDQEYDNGGWTVIQNRFDGSVNFVRPWEEFKRGFGHLSGEFWLGLERVHQITYGTPHELHVVLEDFDGKQVVAKYSEFSIGSEQEFYKIAKLGAYNGTAGDSLTHHADNYFTTFDRDNDKNDKENCAVSYSGAWWHVNCHASNLNGLYLKGATESYAIGMCWNMFRGYHYSLKTSRMMIRSLI